MDIKSQKLIIEQKKEIEKIKIIIGKELEI